MPLGNAVLELSCSGKLWPTAFSPFTGEEASSKHRSWARHENVQYSSPKKANGATMVNNGNRKKGGQRESLLPR